MIVGEPRVVEHDGERLLVDENGDEVVCRRYTTNHSRIYHRVDLDAFAAGEICPPCRVCGQRDDARWELALRPALDGIWRGCRFGPCFGDGPSPVAGGASVEASSTATGYDRAAIASLARSQNHASNQTGGER